MINCELLAPAGSIKALETAVLCGADAVYLGGSLFNARASAVNFNDDELKDAVNFCHLRKVKVYVTVNILISDKEFDELDAFIRKINEFGADGVIVQDIGVAMYIKKIAPDLRLHASTQMTVYDVEGAKFLKSLGFERVVLARELSADKIKQISQKAGIETEIFVHGAMCLCYSGQCLMSGIIGGRSGNRGKCAQPCRLQYSVDNKKGFLMSLKDMCLIRHLKKIESYGVTSLKIEGRMKGPEYVGTVVSIYRKYLESEAKVSKEDYSRLERIFYRGGFSDGYFMNKKGNEMFCHTKPDNPYLRQGNTSILTENYKKTNIFMYFKGHIGEKLNLTVVDEYGNSVEYNSKTFLEQAKSSSASTDKIKENLSKLGDTVFITQHIEIDVDDNVFIPTSEINNARREVTKHLEEQIIKSHQRTDKNIKFENIVFEQNKDEFELSVFVTDKKQLDAIRKTDCKRIYVPIEINDFNENEIVVLPRITPDNLEEILLNIANKEVLVRNIGQLEIAKRCKKNIQLDFTMNVFNKYTCDFYKNLDIDTITISTELTLKQIKPLTGIVNCEAVIYGKLPMMITENCMIKTSVGCKHGGYIYDRTNEGFLIKCLPECRNEIYNSKPIIMSDKMDDIKNGGIRYGRLNFVDESAEKCVEIYKAYKTGKPINSDFTRGKFYKGV